jgi:thiol-disulfide isomerase/thioredoxin
MILRIVLSFVLTLQLTSYGQIKVGEKIDLGSMNLNGLNNATIDTSKIIVIDFWATWCAPCIASFPHLDSIQKKYQDNVDIIALTDESAVKVSRFLEKKKYSFKFFIDEKAKLFKRFNVEFRPLTSVIKEDGTLLWVGDSKSLDAVLDRVLSGKKIDNTSHTLLTAYKQYYTATEAPQEKRIIYDYQIGFSEKTDQYEVKNQKGVTIDSAINIYYRAVPITEIIHELSEVSTLQLINNRHDLDTLLVNITAHSFSKNITYRNEKERIMTDLQRIFGFTIKTGSKPFDGNTLKVINAEKLFTFKETIPGGGMVQTVEGKYKITRLSMSQLAEFLQRKLKTAVYFEGMDENKFNLELQASTEIEILNGELKSKYGLELVPSKFTLKTVELN